uniref:P-type domain-containing protein n=1 Tax=Oryzias sinensis TaxID=183150 RepID=A0A8C7Z4Z0_9TELE
MFSLLVQLTGEDQWIRVNISLKRTSSNKIFALSLLSSCFPFFFLSHICILNKISTPPPAFPGECIVEKSLQIQCGHQVIKEDACTKLGCCYNTRTASCYYRLNGNVFSCSLDGHFVFTVKAVDTHPPIDPSSLVIKDQPQCLPTITTPDVAVFKIGVQDCGAKMKVRQLITVFVFFSLQVECEYEESDLIRAKDLRSFYTVTNPPPVVAQGTIKVQMRIATGNGKCHNASFTAFIPEDQLPLTVPLRKAVNVEISIAQPSPDPTLFLQVCFCGDLVDRHKGANLFYIRWTASHSQVRRFDVKTFAFMDPNTGHPSSEEVCGTCSNHDTVVYFYKHNSSEGERQRRQTKLSTHQLQLVSFGPLLQSGTETETITCEKENLNVCRTV